MLYPAGLLTLASLHHHQRYHPGHKQDHHKDRNPRDHISPFGIERRFIHPGDLTRDRNRLAIPGRLCYITPDVDKA